jgi:hypothetical protein
MNIRHKIALTALGGITAVLLVANGFASASAPAPVGERIDVYLGSPTTFPAGQPFNIRHGWGIGPTEAASAGIYSFRLDVDGTARPADDVARSTGSPPTAEYELPILNRTWIFNFPAGMTGTHQFTGHWIAPCGTAVKEMGYPGPCRSPAEPVDALTRSLTVDFMREDLALGRSVTASNEYSGYPSSASLAVDGDWWSYWNSGDYPPQWIEVDLGSVRSVGEIDLGITQLPDSQTIHRLYGRSSTADPWTLLREFNGFTVDQQQLQYVAAVPQQIRYVRVETTSSLSWVGWREIAVYGP